MRRVGREAALFLAAALVLAWIPGCDHASRLPVDPTTTTSSTGARALDGHTAPRAAACSIGGYRVGTTTPGVLHGALNRTG